MRSFAFAETAGGFCYLPAVSHSSLRRLDIADGDLTGAAILLGIEGDLLTLVEGAHAGALEGRGVDEHILAAIIRRNEAEALLIVVELYGARIHGIPFTGFGYSRTQVARMGDLQLGFVDAWRVLNVRPAHSEGETARWSGQMSIVSR
jgi:hypothetical protein